MWFTESQETPVAEWAGDSALGITGATIQYYYYDGSTKKYVQNDMTATTTPWSFTMTATTPALPNGSAWTHTITLPLILKGFNLTWEATSNQSDLPTIGETHYVGPLGANQIDVASVLGSPFLVVGKQELHSFIWKNSEGVVTTGTATVLFYITDASGMRVYLQGDQTTFGPTPVAFNLTRSGNRWEFLLSTPGTALNRILTAEATHSDTVLPIVAMNYYVTEATLEDVKEAFTTPTKELLFGATQ